MTTMQLLMTMVAAALVPSVTNGICLPYVELATTTTHNYQSLSEQGVDLAPGTTSFKFKVRASNDAHLVLLQADGVTDENAYEVVIGGWNNTQSVIRKGMAQANRVTTRHTPLFAFHSHDFWISWENGVIAVGTGMEVGVGTFMSWTDPSPHAVRDIAVYTGWGSTGLWQFESNLPLVCLETADDYHYHSVDDGGFHLNGQSSFTFWVRATNDAHIALLRNKGLYENDMYEIVIGGWHNTKSVIRDRKGGPILALARHVPLSGNKHLPFWISFSGGTISVGAGTEVGTRQFMSWTDPTPTQIRYVGVATGWGSTGKWLF
ncbi:uncharacterized protein LOC124145114 [Haliotis rufescens]|uniref:uncharacterized protein LOC124145114 n=1 Tax=Haliotis rufescens TaxID=6454 RepID=UPI00201F8AC6|nr:uncharacterized protein LOC124145114 [Haliotis rufescens]